MPLRQRLRAAQGVLDRLVEQPREDEREELVPEDVEEPHRAGLEPVDEPRPVDEFAVAADERLVEAR